MATKKSHHKKTHHKRVGKKTSHRRRVAGRTTTRRRRRVGANSKLKDAAMIGLGIAGGGILAPFAIQMVNTALGSNAASMPGWMVPAGGGLTGVVIAAMADMPVLKGFGAGFGGVCAAMAANEAGISEPGISGTAFSNNAAPGATAATASIGRRSIGSPQRFVNTVVGSMKDVEVKAIGALYSK